MHKLFDMEYAVTTLMINAPSSNNTMRLTTQSLLDANFDDKDKGDIDEIECYISGKSVNKDIDVLAW
jgi:hypothetical protein